MKKEKAVSKDESASFALEIIAEIDKGKIKNSHALEKAKIAVSKKYKFDKIIKNADIALYAKDEKIRKFLKTKPIRTASGVANIAVMWFSENSCPGKCIYCPQGTKENRRVPKSYTGSEPATRRALRYNYDPYKQIKNRLKQFSIIGHKTDKCELIIMGGTFSAAPKSYQDEFIRRCFDAFNPRPSKSLTEAQKRNEGAKNRVIGLTIETRPDYCSGKDIEQMLKLGCTRVELGLQTTDPKILKEIKRGYSIAEGKKAIKRLKDAGLKVCVHWMPGLTGLEKLDIKKEISLFEKLFSDSDYRPDELKIYPTLVIEGTELFELWKNKKYSPLTVKQMENLLIALKKEIPPYVRVKRVMRDISEKEVAAGPKTTNLRQLAKENKNFSCQCIRCREVGLKNKELEKTELCRIEYKASKGKEIFLSYEDRKNKILLGFLRLRLTKEKALIRELHVYGEMAELGKKGIIQHRGYGKMLLKEAEKISRLEKKKIIQITSGVGVRDYYRKLGYNKKGMYMARKI